jgi:hypothetical protein
MSESRSHRFRRLPHLGGSVAVSNIRDRTGEGRETYAISWHSNNGDLQWLSPKIASEEAADIAADMLARFAGATKR